MKYSDIKKLKSKGITYIDMDFLDTINIYYKGNAVISLSKSTQYYTNTWIDLNDCPYREEVWEIATKLAATPIEDREEESKYNVIIGNNSKEAGTYPVIAWTKDPCVGYSMGYFSQEELKEADRTFTESEYKGLLEYIKTLPYADKQLKIAEICKTLVEDD